MQPHNSSQILTQNITGCTKRHPEEEGGRQECLRCEAHYAVALAHMHVLIQALNEGEEHLLVLEDDVWPVELENVDLASCNDDAAFHEGAHNAREHLQGIALELPEGYDIVFLTQGEYEDEEDVVHRHGKFLYRTKNFARCANSYLISRAGMMKMLSHVPVWGSIDGMIESAGAAVRNPHDALRAYVAQPQVFAEATISEISHVLRTCNLFPGSIKRPG